MAKQIRVKQEPRNQTARIWCRQVVRRYVAIYKADDPNALRYLKHVEQCPACRGEVIQPQIDLS